MPGFVEPMLATLAKFPPTGERWLHEIKFDGYRLQAHIEDGRVTLWTRGGLDWTKKFGDGVQQALRNLPVRKALIDGEVVAENPSGVSEFSLLQADLSNGRFDRFVYYAFDCLYLDGYDLRGAALVRRKELLGELIGAGGGAIRYSSHFVEDGKLVLQRACALGLEGIVSKASQSVYVSGRGKSWVKAKCSDKQEFVIAGYVPSSTGRKAIGSLVLGAYDGADLRYVGRVGAGFSSDVAEALFARLDAMRIRSSPFAKRLTTAEARQVRYVKPELIAEIDFRGWTGDGLLRQASFQGLREDKPAHEVVRETTMATNAAHERPKSSVTLTHPDRIYWPDEGVTKEGLADYYAEAWAVMKPLVVNRALALVRCPDGIGGQTFFQKHAWKGLNRNIVLVKDPAEPEPLISIRDFDGLMALVQSAALEIHPWGSTVTDWERPDMIVMDLDPGEDVDWTSVIAAAQRGSESPEEPGARVVRQDLGRQGVACRLADQAESGMARGEGVHQSDRQLDGGRQSRALRLDHPKGEAARQNSHRLSAQPARHDGGFRLFHPREAGRGGLDASRLGGAFARDWARLFHHSQRARAPLLRRRSLGRFPRRGGAYRGGRQEGEVKSEAVKGAARRAA